MSGIDHLVLCAHDLEAARARYGAMGFTLTPVARHPFGTGNSLVQLQGCFLELVTVVAPQDIHEHGPDSFSFPAHNRDFLAAGEGFSMLVLDSTDASADQQRFAAAGIKTYQPFGFSRSATLPSGEEVTVSFSLAFTSDPLAETAGFFTCHQHAPEHFWKPQYQTHANTAHTIIEVCLVSTDPAAHIGFLGAFTDTPSSTRPDGGVILETARGRIMVATPQQFEQSYGTQAPDITDGARLAAYCIGVTDLSVLAEQLEQAELTHVQNNGRILLPPDLAFGVAVAFEQKAR